MFDQELLFKTSEFRKYVASEKWKNLKLVRLQKDDFKCVLCKSVENLVCHHLTYIRLYNERIDDLISLCRK